MVKASLIIERVRYSRIYGEAHERESVGSCKLRVFAYFSDRSLCLLVLVYGGLSLVLARSECLLILAIILHIY